VRKILRIGSNALKHGSENSIIFRADCMNATQQLGLLN